MRFVVANGQQAARAAYIGARQMNLFFAPPQVNAQQLQGQIMTAHSQQTMGCIAAPQSAHSRRRAGIKTGAAFGNANQPLRPGQRGNQARSPT